VCGTAVVRGVNAIIHAEHEKHVKRSGSGNFSKVMGWPAIHQVGRKCS